MSISPPTFPMSRETRFLCPDREHCRGHSNQCRSRGKWYCAIACSLMILTTVGPQLCGHTHHTGCFSRRRTRATCAAYIADAGLRNGGWSATTLASGRCGRCVLALSGSSSDAGMASLPCRRCGPRSGVGTPSAETHPVLVVPRDGPLPTRGRRPLQHSRTSRGRSADRKAPSSWSHSSARWGVRYTSRRRPHRLDRSVTSRSRSHL